MRKKSVGSFTAFETTTNGFMSGPTVECESSLKFILADSPGRIGLFGILCAMHIQLPLTSVSTNGSFPVLVNSKKPRQSVPQLTVPKSYNVETNSILAPSAESACAHRRPVTNRSTVSINNLHRFMITYSSAGMTKTLKRRYSFCFLVLVCRIMVRS